jgi:[ribosomal protein S5]-alanine N-acetyltransferase
LNLHLTTERLHIKPINLSDAAFIKELLNTEDWITYIGERNINSLADAEAYIQKIAESEDFFYHVLQLKKDNTPIGVVTFVKRPQFNYPDIGFALLPQYYKKGYSYEGAQAYLNEVTKLTPYEKIYGYTLQHNTASIKMLEKLGLQFVHFFTDNDEELALYEISTKAYTD